MALPRNKQLAMYILLATRSKYRGLLEGPADRHAGTPAEMKKRFQQIVPLPLGILQEDMDALVQGVNFDKLFVDPSPKSAAARLPHKGNISTDPEVIASALDIIYTPDNPECPTYEEGNLLSVLAVASLPSVSGTRSQGAVSVKYGPRAKDKDK